MSDDEIAIKLGELYKDRMNISYSCKIYPEMYHLFDSVFLCNSSDDTIPLLIYSLLSE